MFFISFGEYGRTLRGKKVNGRFLTCRIYSYGLFKQMKVVASGKREDCAHEQDSILVKLFIYLWSVHFDFEDLAPFYAFQVWVSWF